MNIYDPWFIALCTIVIILIIQPALALAVKRIRSLSGAFSGTYLSITQYKESNRILIEAISILHIGGSVSDSIRSIGVAEINDGLATNLEETIGKYSLDGFVDERVIAISYKTKTNLMSIS